MAAGTEALTWVSALGYRGQHTGRGRRRREAADPVRVVLIGSAGVALVLLTTAAVLPASGDASSPQLSPVPARLDRLPPTQIPLTQPHEPAGAPTALPPSPTRSPAPTRTAPQPTSSTTPTTPADRPPTARPTVRPPVVPVSYEAESASNVLRGHAHIRAVPEASGGQVITCIGGSPANALRFNQIDVPFDGVYTLAIRYLSESDRNATISVNGARSVSLKFPSTSDLEPVGLLAVRVRLDLGENSIEFSNPAAKAPDIDQIIIGG